MIIPFPLYREPLYEMTLPLSGVQYRLKFDYNGREDRYYLSIYTTEGEKIRTGLKVVTNWDVLDGAQHPDRPPGMLAFVDLSLDGDPPTFADITTKVTLTYNDLAA
jgi:hypothetical protein